MKTEILQFVKFVCWILEAIRSSKQNAAYKSPMHTKLKALQQSSDKKSLQRLPKIYFTLPVTMLQFCETFKKPTT